MLKEFGVISADRNARAEVVTRRRPWTRRELDFRCKSIRLVRRHLRREITLEEFNRELAALEMDQLPLFSTGERRWDEPSSGI